MNTLLRILRHRWLDSGDARRALGRGALERIAARVALSEGGHRGELRVCVEAGLPLSYLWRNATPRERAVTMFGKLRVWDTALNNGVLIYLLLAERRIEIVADRGLAPHVSEAQWAAIVSGMSGAFREGRYEAGLLAAIEAVDGLLRLHFSRNGCDRDLNELPDAPDVR